MHIEKQRIRKEVIAKCKQIALSDRIKYEHDALIHILPILNQANTIVIYHALNFEFNLSGIIEYCLLHEKKLYQPLAYRERRLMHFVPYQQQQSQIFSDAEHIPLNTIEWYNIDLILMPLVAVDLQGHRLGKGGGYYDTTLARLGRKRPLLCGVGYSCQLISQDLPYESFDVNLDYFVSESGLICY